MISREVYVVDTEHKVESTTYMGMLLAVNWPVADGRCGSGRCHLEDSVLKFNDLELGRARDARDGPCSADNFHCRQLGNYGQSDHNMGLIAWSFRGIGTKSGVPTGASGAPQRAVPAAKMQGGSLDRAASTAHRQVLRRILEHAPPFTPIVQTTFYPNHQFT